VVEGRNLKPEHQFSACESAAGAGTPPVGKKSCTSSRLQLFNLQPDKPGRASSLSGRRKSELF